MTGAIRYGSVCSGVEAASGDDAVTEFHFVRGRHG